RRTTPSCSRTRSVHSFPGGAPIACWVPTASVARTSAGACVVTSRSIAISSCSRRCASSSTRVPCRPRRSPRSSRSTESTRTRPIPPTPEPETDAMSAIEVRVPDIGDFEDVEVIEVLVSEGDEVGLEQSLVTVESDKASMEIPSSAAGRVKELRVKVGDKVSEGSVLVVLEGDGRGAAAGGGGQDAQAASPAPAPAPAAPAPAPAPEPEPEPRPAAPAPAPASGDRKADRSCALVVIGGGPGGYAAAFRAADLGLEVVLVERYATLGGVC